MKIESLKGANVALVAMGGSHLDFNYSQINGYKYDEVWAINAMLGIIKHDRVIMLDPPSRFLDTNDAGDMTKMMREKLPVHDKPIYTCELDERVPSAVLYPVEEVANFGNSNYLNNTTAFAVAFAYYQEVAHLDIYGADFIYQETTYTGEAGRACTEYWIGKCTEKGITVGCGNRSSLMDTCLPINEKLYGYHRLPTTPFLRPTKDGYKLTNFNDFQKEMRKNNLENVEWNRLFEPPKAER